MVSIRWPFGQAGRGGAPEAKESRAGGVIALSGVGRPRWTPNDYASLAREGYQKNAVAYRCIRMIAEGAAAASAETLTARGDVETPTTVGVLVEALGPGVWHRWDEVHAVVVRVEGGAPESAVEMAVLGGGNALAVETTAGWEVVQYRSAVLVGPGTWRLTGLLRGQQGTEVEMRTGAGAGSVVVFLDDRLARAEIGRGERGLPLVCRTGPAGAPPGGAGFSETAFASRGVHDRPWSPTGLAVVAEGEGLTIQWTPRVRLFGDGWEGEPAAVDPMRFRVQVLDGGVVVRTMAVEGLSAFYPAAALAADFPEGVTATARIVVAQWGEGFGWGLEAEIEAEIGLIG